VEEVGPPVYFKDKDGQLVQVPGMPLEELLELWRLKRQIAESGRPGPILKEFAAKGVVESRKVRFSIQLKIQGEARPTSGEEPAGEPDWFRQHLGLASGVLGSNVIYEGPGRHLVEFNEPSGYSIWALGPPEAVHSLTLDFEFPIEEADTGQRVKLAVPQAVESSLLLTLPADSELTESPQGVTRDVRPVEGGTEVSLRGARGEVILGWQEAQPMGSEPPIALEASGTILYAVTGRGLVADALLTVRSFNGSSFDRIRIRLPSQATLVSGTAPESTVRPLDPAASGQEGHLVEVIRQSPGTEPLEVRLVTEQVLDPAAAPSQVDLGAFEVMGALRQSGHVAIQAAREWRIDVDQSTNIEPASELPSRLGVEDLVGGYEYSTQPWSMVLEVSRRQPQVVVTGHWTFVVSRDQTELDARLEYIVRGMSVSRLEWETGGWEIDLNSVGPASLIDQENLALPEGGVMAIPLRSATSGRLEVTFRATRSHSPGAAPLDLAPPKPRATETRPAEMWIQPEDGVTLALAAAEWPGLSRRPAPFADGRVFEQQAWYSAAVRAGQPATAALSILPRQVIVQLDGRASITADQTAVQESLEVEIARVPAAELMLALPAIADASVAPSVSLDGEPISAEPVSRIAGEPHRWRLSLPAGRQLGRLTLEVEYRLAPTASDSALIRDIPILRVEEAQLAAQEFRVTADLDQQLELAESSVAAGWSSAASESGGSELVARGTRATDLLSVRVQPASGLASPETVVDRSWIQSWLTSSARQDRAAYQIATRAERLEVRLPPGIGMMDVEAWLNRERRLTPQLAADGGVFVAIPASLAEGGPVRAGDPRHRFLLELRYRFPSARTPPGQMTLEGPIFPAGTWFQQEYWEVVVPEQEWMLLDPPELVAESDWGWRGWVLGRRPALNQSQLEAWSGASRQAAPGQGTQAYLFSGFGPVPRLSIRTINRTWIVLVGAGGALAVGLAMLYLPGFRHPFWLAIAAIASAALGSWIPEPAALAVQAAVLGTVLVGISAAIKRALGRGKSIPWGSTSAAPSTVGGRTSSVRRVSSVLRSTESTPGIEPAAPGSRT
jgi:hypothetical protein